MPESPNDFQYELRKVQTEAAEMAEFSAREIDRLQAQVSQLMPLARAYESIDMILRMGQQPQGAGEDSAWKLRGYAVRLRDEVDRAKGQPEAPLPSE